jgi:hypothetical protein
MYRKSEIEHLNLDKWSKIQSHNVQNLLLPCGFRFKSCDC